MARLKRINVDGYRSVEHAELVLPDEAPLILIGENNAGKSNIIKAVDLLCGEMWPGSHNPEDNEFYKRDRNHVIKIVAEFSDRLGRYNGIRWRYDGSRDPELLFRGFNENTNDGFINNEERGDLIAVTVGADRRLSYQLSYTSKYTMLSKLMHRFHRAMQGNEVGDDCSNSSKTSSKNSKESTNSQPFGGACVKTSLIS
jgi:putative ATP-dependent endonuclease of OLD family